MNLELEGEYKVFRQKVREWVFHAKRTVEKREIRNQQQLGMTEKFFFSWRYITRSQIIKGLLMCNTSMFRLYSGVILGKHLKDFVPANDIIRYVA